MNTNLRLVLTLLVPLAATAAVAADDEAAQPQPLEPMTVTAPVPPLDRSLQLLRELAKKSTPCLGCDAVLAVAQPAPGMSLLQYLFASHRSPNEVDAATKQAADAKLHDAPDLDYLKR
jgi:hypothetical protein